MAVKSVNFRGYKTPEARFRRTQRESSPQGLVKAARALGMSDEKIREMLERLKAGAYGPETK